MHPGGRPRIFSTPEELEALGNEYFADRDAAEKPYTIAGLAYHLGFLSRSTIYSYEDRKDKFSDIIKRFRVRIESQREEALSYGNVAGSIFWLKNHGWKDESYSKNEHRFDFSSSSDEELERIAKGED